MTNEAILDNQIPIQPPPSAPDELDMRVISWFNEDMHRAICPPFLTTFISRLWAKGYPPTVNSDPAPLEKLPSDIVDEIVSILDLHTVVLLRRSNKSVRHAVDHSWPFKHIIAAAPFILCIYSFSQAAPYVTVQQLYEEFTHPNCRQCGDFGSYLSIIDCRRCCWNCIRYEPSFFPMTSSEAGIMFGINPSDIHDSDLPRMLTFQGDTYFRYRNQVMKRRYLFSFPHVEEMALKRHGGEAQLRGYIQSHSRARMIEEDRDKNTADVARYMSVAVFPHFDSSTGFADRGRSCLGCYRREQVYLADIVFNHLPMPDEKIYAVANMCYSFSGMVEHFNECEDVQFIWNTYLDSAPMPDPCERCERKRYSPIYLVLTDICDWYDYPEYPSGCICEGDEFIKKNIPTGFSEGLTSDLNVKGDCLPPCRCQRAFDDLKLRGYDLSDLTQDTSIGL